jgi:hypothetical protein
MKKKDYDLIILVIASTGEIYDKLIEFYWAKLIKYIKKNNYKIKIFLVVGNNNNNLENLIEDNDIIKTDVEESLIPGILIKTINAFEMINKIYEYKQIFRTNLSSFLILDNMIKIHSNLSNENTYAGVIGEEKGTTFVSGAGYWLSRDNVELILNNTDKIDYNSQLDDVTIGSMMNNNAKQLLPRYDIIYNERVENKRELLKNIINSGNYHIRIKNQEDRSLDIEYMKEFTNILYSD